MGGRGAFFSGASKQYALREFDQIDTANNGKIRVLKKRSHVEHLHFPIYSNTANTTYFVVDENDSNRIASIGRYRNHRLVESIDLTDTRGIHWHDWHTVQTRKGETQTKGLKDHFDLKNRHHKLIQLARAWEALKT